MAEIVGIVLGLAPLLVQISSGIDKLRDIRQNELLRRPWGGFATQQQFGLLQLLMGDLGMIQGSMHPRFLTRCAKWIGEGPHLDLLEELMHLDFDAGEVETQEWPEPCSSNWRSESVTPDPFFVEYISILCKDNQGFAGMTPLHEAVLFGPPQAVKTWIQRSKKDEKNFLGQTPLHLAVYKAEHLTTLLESGHDVNAVDRYGITPLMYAAATDQEEALYILINAHADLQAVDSRYHRTFFDYAIVRRNWCLIYNLLLVITQSAEKEVAESWVRAAIIDTQLAIPNFDYDSPVSLRHFLALCQDVNFTYDNGEDRKSNCLLHDIKTVSDLEALIDNGFKMINHVNSLGQHALINAAKHHDVAMTARLLELGADVNLEDNQNRTAIGHALRGLSTSDISRTCSTMEVVRTLLRANADVLGCSDRFGWGLHFPIWSFEWLNLIHEHRGVETAREVALSLIREATHEDLDMTHVCCEFQLDECPIGIILGSKKSADDIDEIKDEEQEFTAILDSEMKQKNEEEYEVLLDYWFTLIRELIQKATRKAAETKRQKPLRTRGPDIDYKNDCFVYNTSVDMDQYRNPVPGVQNSICTYVLWMEHEYHHGQTSQLKTSIREVWYSKRASLLRRLLCIIEIPVGSLTDRVRKLQPLYVDGRKDPIDPEPYMEHFRASVSIQ
ncbi:Serine/threonine-protein kinase TNNI3K [Colletotrichum siamense]|uniref:Serine/threonine-protein kinase TNNI3K n=1 Tax=Colletotrichum siamense TaxID=690259 RepID=A0A9P5KAG3_COLSI|nr:Serine/threonine-protein kinase TNNI3K [Colletotrichum siamense]KAF4865897.1 Serine/threonine-protein kinase TNNI3K [Colletotrichum siamense]